MDNKKAIVGKLLQINAIKLSPQQPFTWASGWKSPIYCDNRKALSFPEVRDIIKNEMCRVITDMFSTAEIIAGVATAGISWGALVADQLRLPYIYVRPQPKQHGLGNQIEGFYTANKRVVVVEDLVSTGKSSLQVVDELKKENLYIIGLVSIFNYGFSLADKAFEEAGVKFESLTDYNFLIEQAIETGIVSPSDQNTLLNWRKDPANWGKDIKFEKKSS